MSLAKGKPYYRDPADYEDDVYAWALEQAQLLRLGRFTEVDLPNVIEEIESLGSEMAVRQSIAYRDLIARLLEWRYHVRSRTPELDLAILQDRFTVASVEDDSLSLRARAKSLVAEIYADARRLAMTATGLPIERFPPECPYTIEFLRDQEAMPSDPPALDG